MADGLQDASRHAGQGAASVLLRRNIAVDAETAPARRQRRPGRACGGRARPVPAVAGGARAGRSPAASRCSDDLTSASSRPAGPHLPGGYGSAGPHDHARLKPVTYSLSAPHVTLRDLVPILVTGRDVI